MPTPEITISVVSHRQNALVNQLLRDISHCCAQRIALIVTENVPDTEALEVDLLPCPVTVITNPAAKGYGANQNAAFLRCETPYFCVTNPDVRLPTDPFDPLLDALADRHAAVAAPLVRNPAGEVEDSARHFPTARFLIRKALGRKSAPDYPVDGGPRTVDWVAGMFMLFKSDVYREIRGFDEAYFLYYEDVDVCRRLQAAGWSVVYEQRAEIVHDARRASRRDPRLAFHHLASAARFLSRY